MQGICTWCVYNEYEKEIYKECKHVHIHVIQGTKNTTIVFNEYAQGTYTRNMYKVNMQGYVYMHVAYKEYIQGIAKGAHKSISIKEM